MNLRFKSSEIYAGQWVSRSRRLAGTKVVRNVGNTAWHPRRLEASTSLLYEPPTSRVLISGGLPLVFRRMSQYPVTCIRPLFLPQNKNGHKSYTIFELTLTFLITSVLHKEKQTSASDASPHDMPQNTPCIDFKYVPYSGEHKCD